jgi:hypothetical protein
MSQAFHMKQNKASDKGKPATSSILSPNKGNLKNNGVQKGSDLGFHGLVLWGRFSYIVKTGELLNSDWAQ